jgi:hypothetical protein
VDEDGVLVSSQVEVGECCRRFYSKLYKRCTSDSESARARGLFLENLVDKIPERMMRNLSQPMKKGELHETLETMAKEKAPGPNGVTVEFFLSMWNVIGRYYTQIVQGAIQEGTFPPGVPMGLITLLHKGGDKKSLSNW